MMPTEGPKGTFLKPIATSKVSSEEQEALERLDLALADCGLNDSARRNLSVNRLTNVPGTLLLPMWHRRGIVGAPPDGFVEEVLREISPADQGYDDFRARLLRLAESKADPGATWQSLSRAERMRATRLARSIVDSHPTDISTDRKGRPPEIDSAFVLYLMYALMEALGRDKFSYSTRDEVKRGGPMMRALIATLQFHLATERQWQLALDPELIWTARVPHVPKAEAIVTRIIQSAHSAEFRRQAEHHSLQLTTAAVAEHPALFRELVAEALRYRRRHRSTH